MQNKFRHLLCAIFATAFFIFSIANAQDLQLHDMHIFEARVHEEMAYLEECYQESSSWTQDAILLEETQYPWIDEARTLLIRYFTDVYNLDIADTVNEIEVYAAPGMSDVISGFSDGGGGVYINQGEIERVPERMLHILLHEMLHALGVDFYGDANGMLANGFYEGLTEAATQTILEHYNYTYEDFSGYSEVKDYGKRFLQADAEVLKLLVENSQFGIAAHIDAKLGTGVGKILLECELLLSTGPDAQEIGENCDRILQEYENNK